MISRVAWIMIVKEDICVSNKKRKYLNLVGIILCLFFGMNKNIVLFSSLGKLTICLINFPNQPQECCKYKF